MPTSLNASFMGSSPKDAEYDHPEGRALARLVRQAVQQKGWVAGEPDNWRDVGWSVLCSRGSSRLECAISLVGGGKWILQVAPNAVPGFLGRALGRNPSASPAEVLELSKVVHGALQGGNAYSDFRWRWDGLPKSDSAHEPPQEA